MQPITERRFAACPMAAVVHGEDNTDLFRHYGESQRFDPPLMRADRLSDLIQAVMDRSQERSAAWTTRSATSAA